MLAVLGRVAEGSEAFLLERGNRFGIRFQIDHVAGHKRDHPPVDEHACAAEHAAHRDRSKVSK